MAGFAIFLALLAGAPVFIRAGQVFDGREFLGSHVVVVRDGLVERLLPAAAPVLVGAEFIDARDQTVLPGFTDASIRFAAPPRPFTESPERYGPGRMTAEAMSFFPRNRRQLLADGVTAIADAGAPVSFYARLRKALVQRSMAGPDLRFAGPEITAPGGHPAGTVFRGQHDLIDAGTFQASDTGAVRREVRMLAGQGVDFIAIVYDGADYGNHRVPRLDRSVARAAIDEAHRNGLRAAARVGSENEARAMVQDGADCLEHGFAVTSDSIFAEMAERGTVFIPLLAAGSAPAALPGMMAAVKRAWEIGVPLALGTGFPESGGEGCGDDVYTEMRLWEEAGIPRRDILRAAVGGVAAKTGTGAAAVVSGSPADFVFIAGGADTGILSTARVKRVMLRGKTVVQDGLPVAGVARGFGESSLSLFGYPYWDPLLSYLVGLSVTDFDFLRSGVSVTADALFSFRNMWSANLSFVPPSPVPRTAVRAGIHFDSQNRLFYGIGNDAPLSDPVEHTTLSFREWVSGTTRVTNEWKMMTGATFDQTRVGEYGDRLLPDTLAGRRGRNLAVLALALAHDSRDHQVNPWSGHYASAGVQYAPGGFAKLAVDARGYFSPVHHHVLAGRLLYQQAFGDVPFYYLPEFGGDTLGRGFLPYRFRGSAALIGQFEYRFPVWSFISGAAFVDLGQFRGSPAEFTLGGFHPGFGLGPRFNFGPNGSSILGIDFGFTPEGWNIALHSGQVF